MSETDPESYADILRERLENLNGETPNMDTVQGQDFWLVGENGAAATYSSGAGKRILVGRLREDLPQIEIE